MLIELVTLAAFFGIVGLVFFLRSLVRGWRGGIQEQIANEASEAPTRGPLFGEWTEALASQLPSLMGSTDDLTRDLQRAGYYKPTARSEFLALRNALAIFCIVMTGIYAVMVGPERRDLTAPILIWGMAISALVYVLPWIVLRMQAKRRLHMIQRSMPDAFDMLTMCMTGGLAFNDALGHVSREVVFAHPDMAVELEIVRRHADMNTMGRAFENFAKRIDTPEVVSMAGLVSQSERLGTNMVAAVREYADGVRLMHRQNADERANKAGIKLLFPMVLCLAPAAMIILWGPAILELRNFFRTFNVTN
ncbi:MAG: type II secretion system F family protein [Planctomycetes bacterium]|nr:type II secretion system F family protein [Planctomycetota bacterium]